jgi:hypothetical protein
MIATGPMRRTTRRNVVDRARSRMWLHRGPRFVAAAAVLLIAGCGISLYAPTEANVNKRHDATLDEMREGRELYVQRCSSCHSLHRPQEFTSDEWSGWLDKMQPKAKIDDEQKDLIRKYLVNW